MKGPVTFAVGVPGAFATLLVQSELAEADPSHSPSVLLTPPVEHVVVEVIVYAVLQEPVGTWQVRSAGAEIVTCGVKLDARTAERVIVTDLPPQSVAV